MAGQGPRRALAPIGLPYLVSEGILPDNPPRDAYQWETYLFRQGGYDDEWTSEAEYHEILATKNCVLWSQGRFVRNVYRFDLEGEEVVQALLTHFPRHSRNRPLHIEAGKKRGRTASRAVVVFLRSKAHIYFLHGSRYILDLPVEVERALPAPYGVIIQRKASDSSSFPLTPPLPAPPPSSFMSSQLRASSSYLLSPTVVKSFGSTQPSRPSPLGSNNRLDALFHDAFGSGPPQPSEENLAPLYSLTDPLSEFGVVTYSLQHHRPRLSGKTRPGLVVDFEPLDPSEQVIYVSSQDELSNDGQADRGSITLIVTTNIDLQTLTIWHAWHVDEQSLASLVRQRAAQKAAKVRRRSSFLSAGMGTGTATPAARHREGTRESFTGAGSIRLPGESVVAHPTAMSSKKPTRQEEEDAMASQMDPDYQPSTSQQATRESRRISSLNSDIRSVPGPTTASFAAGGGRRNTSFGGGPNERRSFGHRKSRGSTPGSVFGRSLGPEDDSMDIDFSLDSDSAESVESIVRHVRATFDASGTESIFGSADGDLKTDLVVRKLHSMPLSLANPSAASALSSIRVITLADPMPRPENDDQRLAIYFHDVKAQTLSAVSLLVKHRPLWPAAMPSFMVAVPLVQAESKVGSCTDVTKVWNGAIEAILLDNQSLILSVHSHAPLPLPGGALIKETGATHSNGQLQLWPNDARLGELLKLCRLAFPPPLADLMIWTWCAAHTWLLDHPETMAGTVLDPQWIAFATAAFSFVVGLLDRAARAELKGILVVPKHANRKRAEIVQQQQAEVLSQQTPWCKILGQIRSGESQPVHPVAAISRRKDELACISMALADHLSQSATHELSAAFAAITPTDAVRLMLGLHIYREEQKLCTLNAGNQCSTTLSVIAAQIGNCIGLPLWSYSPGSYYELEGASNERWEFIQSNSAFANAHPPSMTEPVGIFAWFEHAVQRGSAERYPTIDAISGVDGTLHQTQRFQKTCRALTPRITALVDLLEATSASTADAVTMVEMMNRFGINMEVIEQLPSAIAAPLREAIAACEKQPPTTWKPDMLRLVGRDDLDMHAKDMTSMTAVTLNTPLSIARDVQTICNTLDHHPYSNKTKEADRHAVSQLLFNEDRRLVEATSLMHYNSPQVAECPKQPDWTDAYHLEQQRKVMQWVTIRMISLPAGDGMLHFDSQTPLLTDKYHLAGFNNSCLMQPMGHTLTTDRSGLTEERVNWAYFHAGVSAGLRISKGTKGIDTSWVAFNKPNDLTNRHAGLLLALGLNGHLRNLAKWLSFKYLTPKHTMTSVGLLLGLSASYMGTMDGLITRMLSVHITRMLPPGAAELNVSPITQTAGLMGIGLLYYNTQHRRMSEVMVSEIEHMELEDPDSGPDPLRDESYRLAAGFALGFINLGKGRDLRGLHGMYLPERLLAVAVGPRPVNAVHVFDRATAGAVIALALAYMKSGDEAIARKINIPDAEAQFDHVRPDILMLRAMSKHLILWEDIAIEDAKTDGPSWIHANLPPCYNSRFQQIHVEGGRQGLKSSDIPFFNITTGLAWALSLKYAGSGNVRARDEILAVLDYFHAVQNGGGAHAHTRLSNYDTILTRSTLRRCVDALAVFAATVMAGSGDLKTFRYLRRLHGRTDAETPYGSHLAAHLAIGILFLGGGTYTFGTSNLAIASLICAFYPLTPTDVHDNHVHLQAFRHLWVFAAEARCLIVEDIDTQRPISIPLVVSMKDGSSRSMTAPGLLPELDTIARVHTNDPAYWRVTLDFADNPQHLASFKEKQRIFVRRCPAAEAHSSVFFATLSALFDVPASAPHGSTPGTWHSIFRLPAFKALDRADLELILPPDLHNSIYTDARGTVVDDRLGLERSVNATNRDALWNLRMLFAWAETARDQGRGKLKWIGHEVVEALKAKIEERKREIEAGTAAL